MRDYANYRVTDDQLHKQITDCIEATTKIRQVWQDYAESIGAKGFGTLSYFHFRGFYFPRGGQREGWTKINSRGFSEPYKRNKEALAEIAKLPRPNLTIVDIMADLGLGTAIGYEELEADENEFKSSGSFRVGYGLFGWAFSMINDKLFLHGPDYEKIFADYPADIFEITLNGHDKDGKSVAIPCGAERRLELLQILASKAVTLSEARYDLEWAEQKVTNEEKEEA